MPKREPHRELPAHVREVTGYRYCTAVRIGYQGSVGEAVLLAGDHPYDADQVERELVAHGYEVDQVEAGTADRFPWRAWIRALPAAQHGLWAVVLVPLGQWDDWRSIKVDSVFYAPRYGTWAQYWGWESEDDDDRELVVTLEQAQRISRLFAEPLPDADRREQIHQQTKRRRARQANRYEDLYEQRAARFGAVRERLRADADELASNTPVRDVATSRYGTDPDVVAWLPALPLAAGETFPLVRFMHGQFTDQRSWFVANKITVATPGGPITLTLTVWTVTRPLEYLAVTPFVDAEGYPLDEDDTDSVRRAAKLDGSQKCWGGIGDTAAWMPASPARLWILSDPVPAAGGDDLWLELTFPDGNSYLSAPIGFDRDHAARLVYQEFVPADLSDLAEVPGLAPRWVSIQVPPFPDLLKTVTARVHHQPDRTRPHQPAYFEH